MNYKVVYAPRAENGLVKLLREEPKTYQKTLKLIRNFMNILEREQENLSL